MDNPESHKIRTAQVFSTTAFIHSTIPPFFDDTATSYLRSTGATTLDQNKHAIIYLGNWRCRGRADR
jgi:hypothetical protein